jgi:hypothetical protein
MPPRLMVRSWIAAYHLPHWQMLSPKAYEAVVEAPLRFKPLTQPYQNEQVV